MASERLLEPLCPYVGVDLGVDHEWSVAPSEPAFERRRQVFAAANRDALSSRRPRERGEVGFGEAGEIHRVPHRAEVVYLRAVSRVVVNHDEHRQTVAGGRLQLAQGHQSAAIAYGRDTEPIGSSDHRADRAAE